MAIQELVAAPTRRDRLGGISRVATLIENARLGATEEVVFLSDGCTFPQSAIGLCYGEVIAEEKTSTGVDTLNGISEPFALYAGVECWLIEGNDYAERAQRLLTQGADRTLEDRLGTWADGGTALAAATSVTEAIANVEQSLDANYPGQGVILMNRADAVLASAEGSLDFGIDGVPVTVHGTPVISSGSITAGTVYGVGAITVLRSEFVNINALDVRTNRDWAVAEAVYAILVDCEYRVHSAWEAV